MKLAASIALSLLVPGLAPTAPAEALIADTEAFLLGNWSHDCAAEQVTIYRERDDLMQRGMVTLSRGPGTLAEQPPTTLDIRRLGDRIVLVATLTVDGSATAMMYRLRIIDTDTLQLEAAKNCIGDAGCAIARVDESYVRCRD